MRWQRRNAPVDGGFTLTELMVVITLMTVIGAIVLAATVSGLQKQRQMQDRNDAASQGRKALQRIDRDIRAADPVLAATDSTLVLKVIEASVTRTMTYSVVTQSASRKELVVDESDLSSSGVTTTVSRKVLATNLVGTSSSPVFAYDHVTGYSTTSGTINPTTCYDTSTSSYAVDCIGTVTVHLQLQPTSLTSAVDMSDNGTDLRNQS